MLQLFPLVSLQSRSYSILSSTGNSIILQGLIILEVTILFEFFGCMGLASLLSSLKDTASVSLVCEELINFILIDICNFVESVGNVLVWMLARGYLRRVGVPSIGS